MSEDDTDDLNLHRLGRRLEDMRTWVAIHERDHTSYRLDIQNAAGKALEVEKQLHEFLAEWKPRKEERDKWLEDIRTIRRNTLAAVLLGAVVWLFGIFLGGFRTLVALWLNG